MFSQTYFGTDRQGHLYSSSDAVQLQLLGVDRIYQGSVLNPYREDTAHWIGAKTYIPDEAIRRQGIVYVSRSSLESALWHFRNSADHLTAARERLLNSLRFETMLPYRVYLDPLRCLYVFATLVAGTTESDAATPDASQEKVPRL